MKRGLIRWDQEMLPPAAFAERLRKVRAVLAQRDVSALVVYSDVWRSNHARYLTNFMPYWNRSLVVIPREGDPVFLCALSPRVYPWIRSVTIVNDIRPAPKLVHSLTTLCVERGWTRIGVLDLSQLIEEIRSRLQGTELELVEIPSADVIGSDESDLAMRQRAAQLARRILATELPKARRTLDYQFVGRLEREYRRSGAEDLVILVSNGLTPPGPPTGTTFADEYSISVAVEYRGHWAKITRAQTNETHAAALRNRLLTSLKSGQGLIENLAGPYPYEIGKGPYFALHIESAATGPRLFYGDTCRYSGTQAQVL